MLLVLFANALTFAVAFAVCELGLRVWREGGIGPGLASLIEAHPTPRNLGTGGWLQDDPECGYVLRRGQDGVNSLGIRHAELGTKPANQRRLLLVGDSVTWPSDGYAAMVTRLLADQPRPIEVVNAAVPGYTIHQERIHLERLLVAVAPDVVVLQYCLNDNHRFLHQFTSDGQWLITVEARRALLPDGDDWWTRLSRWSYVALEIRQRWFAVDRRRDGPFPWRHDPSFAAAWRDDSWPMVTEELTTMHRFSVAAAAPLLVVAIPYAPQLLDESLRRDPDYTTEPQRRLAAICASLGRPLLDLFPCFLAHRDEELFTDGIHLSPRGHELVAEQLVARLRADGLIGG